MKRINRWLAHRKIAHKLILSSVVFALPIAVLTYYVVAGFNRDIRTLQREVAGTRALELYPGLLRDLARLELDAELVARGSGVPQEDPVEAQRRVNNSLAELRQVAVSGTTDLADQSSKLWERAQEQDRPVSARERAAIYHQMLETVSQLVRATLDSSSLTLDTELDSYYLMELSCPLLLQAQSALVEVRSVACRGKAKGGIEDRDVASLQAQQDRVVKTVIPGLRDAMETSIREDKRLHGGRDALQKNVGPLCVRYVAALSSVCSELSRSTDKTEADLAADRIVQLTTATEDAGVALGEASIKGLRDLLMLRIADDGRRRFTALLLSLLCVSLAAGVVAVLTRNIIRPLEQVVNLTAEIAEGRVKEAIGHLKSEKFQEFFAEGMNGGSAWSGDEICGLLRSATTMTENLNNLLTKVAVACNQVAGSATQMAAAVGELEAVVTEQAASASQLTATSNEIHATVRDFARRMASVTNMAAEAADTASAGVSSLTGIRHATEGLVSTCQAMTQTFESISEKTGNIDEVISAITRVANRTNLLSLNAAIEAEKAGEKAGGFSVVAVEMRRLADQTAVAALDIEKQIREMQQSVHDGVARVESYARQTQESSVAVSDLSTGLARVIDGTRKLGPEFEALNTGMQVQSQGAGQIADSMLHLRDAANQTKASLVDLRKVAEDLHSAARDLQVEMGRFSTAA